jgi:serralysin
VIDGFSGQSLSTLENGNEIVEIIDLRLRTANAGTATVYSGTGSDMVMGSAAKEVVLDGSGDDIVMLYGGNDVYYASSGDDDADGGTGTDWLSFAFLNNDGLTPITANNVHGVTVDLQITTPQNFGAHYGEDKISGFENVDGGNAADTIYGNSLANELLGSGGNDKLFGRGGNDRLFGEAGSDQMTGGAGADAIHCGLGTLNGAQDGARDTIFYELISDSGTTASTRDTIYYFKSGSAATDDRINLNKIDGNAALAGLQDLVWRGNAASFGTDPRGEVRIQDLGAHVIVHIDTDADSASEMTIAFWNVGSLVRADFIL